VEDFGLLARRRYRLASWIAAVGALLTALQALLLQVRGSILCLNDGCRVVEGLTTVSPLVFNLLGCAWFSLTAYLLHHTTRRQPRGADWASLLMLAGAAAEGTLVAYQAFVAGTFCSWCLTVFALVLAMNVAAGWTQALKAGTVLVAAVAASSLLRYGVLPHAGGPGERALDAGTFAVRRCSDPAKQLYLIFSSNCPHCREVMKTLENCNSCNFHFNPIDRITSLDLAGLEQAPSYEPSVNRAFLGLLGVDEVPVLIAPGPEGVSVIRGEKRILAYVGQECFRTEPLLNMDPSRSLDAGSLQLFRGEDAGCNVQVECGPDGKPLPGAGNP
jgi:uncharacterized membrane protein